ncbi:MAG: helix-turn-helix domain-containing protein [Anaerolineales bacterium]|nr:helix-turn-helix domain-containing protein [Anaerolineales bacterium]
MDKLLTMSDKEVSRLEVMQRLKEKSLSQREAAKILGVSVRHVRRLFKAYLEKGAAGLVSQRRGRASNNRLSEATRQKALDFLGSKYRGFGPTLACEKLVEVEGLKISNESVRKMMMAAGLPKAYSVENAASAQDRHAPDARAQAMPGRTGADRRLTARLVRRTRSGLCAAGVYRRCYWQTAAIAVRGKRELFQLLRSGAGLF